VYPTILYPYYCSYVCSHVVNACSEYRLYTGVQVLSYRQALMKFLKKLCRRKKCVHVGQQVDIIIYTDRKSTHDDNIPNYYYIMVNVFRNRQHLHGCTTVRPIHIYVSLFYYTN